MDYGRVVLNIGFWVIFSAAFDAVSGTLFPDLSWDMQIYLWFFGLCAGTLVFNLGYYWFRLRR
ncbi:MAG TPA: hypothetical protein VEI81_02485 [Methanoregula sp.]|nr:hypothetical protein [Methanoregula sp.]